MKRIGIPIIINDDIWMGGINYFFSLLSALNGLDIEDFEFFVLTNRPDLFEFSYKKHIKILDCPFLIDNTDRVRRLCRHFSTDIRLAYYSKKYDLALITHAMPGRRFMPRTLYWMPDFQHCHLPQFFSEVELKARDANIVRAIERSGHLLLSSHAAEADFRTFFPQYASAKTHVLQFAPLLTPVDKNHKLPLPSLEIEEPFFFLPNQFWVHKNHRVVIEALALLPESFKVICTGSLSDYRNARHIEELQQLIRKLGLEQRFIILGMVEREKMLSLMQQTIAVINPSLFEGWSTTVEEAKYMGKRLLLSDLNVHREQKPLDAIFFDPESPEELAIKMQQIMNDFSYVKESQRYVTASEAYPKAVEKFGNDYINIINSLIYADCSKTSGILS